VLERERGERLGGFNFKNSPQPALPIEPAAAAASQILSLRRASPRLAGVEIFQKTLNGKLGEASLRVRETRQRRRAPSSRRTRARGLGLFLCVMSIRPFTARALGYYLQQCAFLKWC